MVLPPNTTHWACLAARMMLGLYHREHFNLLRILFVYFECRLHLYTLYISYLCECNVKSSTSDMRIWKLPFPITHEELISFTQKIYNRNVIPYRETLWIPLEIFVLTLLWVVPSRELSSTFLFWELLWFEQQTCLLAGPSLLLVNERTRSAACSIFEGKPGTYLLNVEALWSEPQTVFAPFWEALLK